jgi:Leucine-rich repeat (LRR) protein
MKSFSKLIPTYRVLTCLLSYALVYSKPVHDTATLTLPISEYNALYEFYNSTNGPYWTWTNTSIFYVPWNFDVYDPSAPCSDFWGGLSCYNDISTGVAHVQEIALSDHGLSGTLPTSISVWTYLTTFQVDTNNITSTLPSSIGNWTQLTTFTINTNLFIGSIPSSIGSWFPLIQFDVRNNFFNGTIPEELYSLYNLTYLRLSTNYFHGTISNSLGKLTNLTAFVFLLNEITGSIPSSIGNLTKLLQLDGSYNHLSKSLPKEFYNCNSLVFLDLSNNTLTGTISSRFSNFTSILFAFFYYNSFFGKLSNEMFNIEMKNVKTLSFNDNLLSGSFPETVSNWSPHIQSLFFSSNSFTGTLPTQAFQQLSLLVGLEANFNFLYGDNLPAIYSDLNRLVYVDMGSNGFSGSLYLNSNWTYILYFIEHVNYFTGSLVGSFENSPSLYYYDIGTNYVDDMIPSWLFSRQFLTYFNLSYNHFYGKLNDSVGQLLSMTEFSVSYNELTGTLPLAIGNCHRLIDISVNANQFTGTVPITIADLKSLQVLFVQDNSLTGSMPDDVLPSLTNIDISNNLFTGNLPSGFTPETQLSTFAASSNCFIGSIPTQICAVETLTVLALDGLSTAQACRIPIFPDSQELNAFILKSNFIDGIPTCLFKLKNLETLHLSGNGFTGSLPENLTLGSTLQDLSLSHNRLTGTIPLYIQEKIGGWYNLDLSYNRFTGVLSNSFTSDDSTISLQINRLSGDIPSSLLNVPSVSILDGNMFTCNFDKERLPKNDNKRNDYTCGSDVVNVTLYIWLFFFICFLTFLMIYYYKFIILVKNRKGENLRDTQQSQRTSDRRSNRLTNEIDSLRMSMHHNQQTTSTSGPVIIQLFWVYCHQVMLWRRTFLQELLDFQLRQQHQQGNGQHEERLDRERTTNEIMEEHKSSISLTQLPNNRPFAASNSLFHENQRNETNHQRNLRETEGGEPLPPPSSSSLFNMEHQQPSSVLPPRMRSVSRFSLRHSSVGARLSTASLFIKISTNTELSPFLQLNVFFQNIRRTFFYMTIFTIFFLLPIYSTITTYYPSFSVAYAWSLSGLLITGEHAAMILVVVFLFTILLFMFLYQLLLFSLIDKNDEMFSDITGNVTPTGGGGRRGFERNRASSRVSSSGMVNGNSATQQPSKYYSFRKSSLVIIAIGNFLLMLLADILYVYVVINYSTTIVILAEFLLAIVKISLNNSLLWRAIPYTRKYLRKWFLRYFYNPDDTDTIRGRNRSDDGRSRSVSHEGNGEHASSPSPVSGSIQDDDDEEDDEEEQVFYQYTTTDLSFLSITILLNNIIFPAIAILIVSSDCFYTALFSASSVSSTYTYEVCQRKSIKYSTCLATLTYYQESSYSPPFIYSYQCASRIIINYASVFILMYIFEGIIQPFVKLGLRFYYDYLFIKCQEIKEEETRLRADKHLKALTDAAVGGNTSVEDNLETGQSPSKYGLKKFLGNSSTSFDSSSVIQQSAAMNSTTRAELDSSYASTANFPISGKNQAAFSYPWLLYRVKLLLPYNLRDLIPTMPTLKHRDRRRNVYILFDKNRLTVRISSYFIVFLTFGILFPPVALIICITVFSITTYDEVVIGRLLYESGSLGYSWYRKQLEKNCLHIANSFKFTIWTLIPISCALFAYIIFDTWGDEGGYLSAITPAIIMFGTPIMVLIVFSLWKVVFSNYCIDKDHRKRNNSRAITIGIEALRILRSYSSSTPPSTPPIQPDANARVADTETVHNPVLQQSVPSSSENGINPESKHRD